MRDQNHDKKKEQALSITFSQYDWFISQYERSWLAITLRDKLTREALSRLLDNGKLASQIARLQAIVVKKYYYNSSLLFFILTICDLRVTLMEHQTILLVWLAQSVEQRTIVREVVNSTPAGATLRVLRQLRRKYCFCNYTSKWFDFEVFLDKDYMYKP